MEKNKVAFYTLGCKVNQYETNGMIQKFQDAGYEVVDFEDKADIYVINTCTVTNMSDRKSRQMLRQAKKNNPEGLVVAVGCYAQVAKDEVSEIEEIDMVLGTNEKTKILEHVENYFATSGEDNIEVNDVLYDGHYEDFGTVTYTDKTRAVIKIQDGCDRFCSYCKIPFARGKVRSRKPESVLAELEELALRGVKEVVLTGIHLASYGKDFDNGYKLIDLLEEVNEINGIERIRLGSIEPLLISDEFIKRLVKLSKVCHHFHLSLQSGCTKTLERMNRRYTITEFEQIVDRLRVHYSDVILTTDIIVGFPGETDEEFEETYRFLKRIKFYKMHIFKYSPREGTKAAEMPNQVSGEVKEIRSKRLLELSDINEKDYLNKYLDKKVEVLFEEKDGDYIKGHTQNYLMVKTKYSQELEDKIKTIKVKFKEDMTLVGDIVE